MEEDNVPINGVIYPSRTKANLACEQGHWVGTTAGNLIRRQAQLSPTKTFIIGDHLTVSYEQFDTQTEILAASLLDLGLHPGDRALFQMGTIAETLIALFACYKAGIIPVCTLPQHRDLEISTITHLTKAKAHFVQADFSQQFNLINFAHTSAEKNEYVQHIIITHGTGDRFHSLEYLSSRISIEEARTRLSNISIDYRDVLTFQLSGGSTNIPKIIPRFHAEYIGQAQSIVKRFHFSESDVAIWPLPLIHNAAMLLVVFPILLSQGTLVLQQRFDLPTFLSAIKQYSVSFAGSIGPIASKLLECERSIIKNEISSLRMFFALDRAEAIENHLNVPTTNLYGITEGLLMTCAPHDPSTMRFNTVGYSTCAADQIRILKPGTEQEANEGELCFRGPYTLQGYYNSSKINEMPFTRDGFFRSGDLVRRKNYGDQTAYTFLGRLKDNISRGGEKFASEEVERLIVLHPSIIDAKVVAMPDQYYGEKACVFVIIHIHKRCPTVGDLNVFLDQQGLARYKHPERIEIIQTFPLTKVGKVDKAAMRLLIKTKLSKEQHETRLSLRRNRL